MAERVMSLYFEDNNIRIIVANGKKVERWGICLCAGSG